MEPTRLPILRVWRCMEPVIPVEAVEAAGICPHCVDEYMNRINRASITTVEELEALPCESVIRDAGGHVLERWGGPDVYFWVTVMVPNFIPPDQITLPATVLHVGDAP